MILQPKHLAIVRAALTYWDEEMGTASYEMYRHYLHSRDTNECFTPEDIVDVRVYFNRVVHKYGLADRDSEVLVSTALAGEATAMAREPGQQIVSVLIH